MFKRIKKMFTGIVRHWHCHECHHAFTVRHEVCPYCKSQLTEVVGEIGTKGETDGKA